MPKFSRDDLVFEKNKNCDRCGFTYHEKELSQQEGLWLCPNCLDELNPHTGVGEEMT